MKSTDFSEIINAKDHLLLLKNDSFRRAQTLKILLKHPTYQCNTVIQGHRCSSDRLEIYITPMKHIQELKERIRFLSYNTCLYIGSQIFKYIIRLVSPTSKDAENAIKYNIPDH